MTVANRMREITDKIVAQKAAKEEERISGIYNSFLSKIEKIANEGLSSAIIKNQGLDNDKIVDRFISDGFKVDVTKMNDNYVTW
jgi:hypothetical protein